MNDRLKVEGDGVYWGELAPCDHVMQIYEDDESFLETLENFVAEGLDAGEGVIVIATASHREALARRLEDAGHDLALAALEDRYVALSAQDTLDRFMVSGSPDEDRFLEVVQGVIGRARGGGRKVRAFGEMVALLWARGNRSATVRLEYLWNGLLRSERFPLYCAYPRFGFTPHASLVVDAVCAEHTRVIET
jgi:hypothetical protein